MAKILLGTYTTTLHRGISSPKSWLLPKVGQIYCIPIAAQASSQSLPEASSRTYQLKDVDLYQCSEALYTSP